MQTGYRGHYEVNYPCRSQSTLATVVATSYTAIQLQVTVQLTVVPGLFYTSLPIYTLFGSPILPAHPPAPLPTTRSRITGLPLTTSLGAALLAPSASFHTSRPPVPPDSYIAVRTHTGGHTWAAATSQRFSKAQLETVNSIAPAMVAAAPDTRPVAG